MKKYLLQHCTENQAILLNTSKKFNEAHAKKTGYEYIVSDMKQRITDSRPPNYEKIPYLKEMLPKLEEGALVVWLDSDAICLPNCESFDKALPNNQIMGMVQMLGGVNCAEPQPWHNIGVIVMKNCHIVRDYFNRVNARGNEGNDEFSAMRELKENSWQIGEGFSLFPLHAKWNCWKNNVKTTKNPNVVSFHGIRSLENKMSAINEFIKKIG